MRLLDKKFSKHRTRYILQSTLAGISAMIALMALDAIANAAVIGAIGASAFVAFTMPHRDVSNARYLIGGYLTGIAAGTLCFFISRSFPLDQLSSNSVFLIIISFAGLAVGLAIFLMVVTNTEHPPAAGLAMGLVLNDWNIQAVIIVLIGIAFVVSLKKLLKPLMIDLL